MYIEIDENKLKNKIYEMLNHFMLENPKELNSYYEAYGCLMTALKDVEYNYKIIESEIDSLGYSLMDNSGKKDKPDSDGVTPMEHKIKCMNGEITDLIKMAMICKVYLHKAYALAVAKKNEYEENEEKPTETEKPKKPKETKETNRNRKKRNLPKNTQTYPRLPE